MLTRIQALNFRSLQYVDQELAPFQVLVGPNASGKSTFLDVVGFLSDLVTSRDGVEGAVRERTHDVRDLTWMRKGTSFELAVEASLPEHVRTRQNATDFTHLRYEVRVGLDPATDELSLLKETLWLVPRHAQPVSTGQRKLFPFIESPPPTILWEERKGHRKVVNLTETGNVYFGREQVQSGLSMKIGRLRSGLGSLPEDSEKYPAGTWFRSFLYDGVQRLALIGEKLRSPSPPGAPRLFRPDGSNLPWVVQDFKEKNPERFQEWLDHVQTALPDVQGIETIERPEDRHRYLVLKYKNGLEAPSWLVSDGSLRLLALTLLAYLPETGGAYLIEEPENGIHPRAVDTVFQALSSAYAAQVFLASHSPVVLSASSPKQVLCFARTPSGATDIVRGDHHPALAEWKGQTDLGTLFAGGVLG